ncbi:Acyl-CoA N-acyltransferase [Cordyceps fumosorosea ARSEF 2679]|uniref:Acyl-CoA N-acyltransferase n=1 Tax=Cordyceps fumosorosea (strain ARSEF 2679) TaxID=1081104 RepID=A0A168BSA8_CORFA|nr:Acyl-CoA N-acyltransferase [Cordyceps fumosorosea ARSEF 2679]OAA70485.1 Acyl-CoA N-acyltransferase [Cordyceps fumosorosea ARSEF 2679]
MAAGKEITRGEVELVAVTSTLPVVPFPPPEQRAAILTERLLLRPYQEADLQALYEMQSDPEVAQWTSTGIAHTDIQETKKSLEPMLQNAAERQDYVICQASTGQVIGQGGCHRRCGTLGWPEIGYSLRKEFWGQGYGTEFLQGFLQLWWTLPRAEVHLNVDKTTIPDGNAGGVVPECMVAITIEANKASRGVMAKGGFELVRRHPVIDLRDNTQTIDLFCHAARRPRESQN